MASSGSNFGSGLGGVIGGMMASDDLQAGQDAINANVGAGEAQIAPYESFGSSFLHPTQTIAGNDTTVGAGRFMNGGQQVQSFGDFMKDYSASPGTQYEIGQAQDAINNSAAARGNLLSGSTLRALDTTTQGIASTNANNAYNEYLAGNQQQFGQLQSALGNLFQSIGVGQTATGQNASLVQSQNNATASIAGAEAKADAGIGSGIGSMFGGLAGLAAK